MKSLFQIGIVFAVCFAGEMLSDWIPIGIPASVMSMILLFVLLVAKWVKPGHIERFSDFLLRNMPFFFIPAGVAIIEQFDLLRNNLIQFFIICVLTTIFTFFATAYTVRAVMAIQNKIREGRKHE